MHKILQVQVTTVACQKGKIADRSKKVKWSGIGQNSIVILNKVSTVVEYAIVCPLGNMQVHRCLEELHA